MSNDQPVHLSIDGSQFSVGIVAARYNQALVDGLLNNAINQLKTDKVLEEHIRIVRVPGSNETPYVANMLAMSEAFDVIIALGVVIAGDTSHHDMIANTTAQTFQTIGIEMGIPVINGIITTNTRAEAEERTTGELNRGKEFAQAALEMAWHKSQLQQTLDMIEEEAIEDLLELEDDLEPFDNN